MSTEQIFAAAGLVVAGVLIEQAGLVPRVRLYAWAGLTAVLSVYVVLRVAPNIVPR